MLESLGKFGAAGADGAAVEGFSSTTLLTTSADFRALLNEVLRDTAAAGPAVIIGHAAQVALRDVPGVLHVFLHAPMAARIERYIKTHRVSPTKAQRDLEDSDRERVRFYQSAYQVTWYDLRLYDVVRNTQIAGVERTAEMIADLARRAAAAAPAPAPVAARPEVTVSTGEESGAPAATITLDGSDLRVRPMSPGDAGALLALFRSLPPEDLLFLRRDVTNEHVLDAWARDVADGRIVTLLAETPEGEVVGEASMYPSQVPWTRHVAEVRVITSPATRARGLGGALLAELMRAASAAGVEKLTAEMTVEQTGARRLFERMGFVEEGRFRNYARDQSGKEHDLVVMTYTKQ
ncbi:MAG: GNAT family N-acetyltransferase [Dehalococcoidia bacterium]